MAFPSPTRRVAARARTDGKNMLKLFATLIKDNLRTLRSFDRRWKYTSPHVEGDRF